MLNHLNNSVLLFENFMSKERCERFIQRYKENKPNMNHHDRNWVYIPDYDIVKEVKQFLENMLPIKIEGWNAGIGVWLKDKAVYPIHVHDKNVRPNNDFTTLIYLNDDFDDGEFYTERLTYKPKTGSLVFFNGMEMMHGVKGVRRNDRYYLIFWWENTTYNQKV
jgi:hypothetical protein